MERLGVTTGGGKLRALGDRRATRDFVGSARTYVEGAMQPDC